MSALLEDLDAFAKKGEYAEDVVILPFLNELDFGELEVVLFLVLC